MPGRVVTYPGGAVGRPIRERLNVQPAGRFRKLPVIIEAMPFDGTWESAKPILEWIEANKSLEHSGPAWGDREGGEIHLTTLGGRMTARAGWWVIRGVKGEFYGCEPGVFAATYEPA